MVAFTTYCYLIFHRHLPFDWRHSSGALHLFHILMKRRTGDKEFETVVVINTLFLITYLLFREKSLLFISVVISLVCLVSKRALYFINHVWTKFFFLLGELNSRLLLFLIFYLVLVPIAFLKKVFSKQENRTSDNFKVRNHVFIPKDLERMG